MKRRIHSRFFIPFLFSIVTISAKAQDKKSDPPKQYIKVQSTGNVFMCPVLTPRFTNQLTRKYGATDIKVSDDKNIFYFTTTHILNRDSIIKAATNSAIPLNIITEIIISDKPIAIDPTKVE